MARPKRAPKDRHDPALLLVIDDRARAELSDVLQRFPELAEEKNRLRRLEGEKKAVSRYLNGLAGIVRRTTNSPERRQLLRRLVELRQWLLHPKLGAITYDLANASKPTAHRPAIRERRIERLDQLIPWLRETGYSLEDSYRLIAEQYARVWTAEAGKLSRSAHRALWGFSAHGANPKPLPRKPRAIDIDAEFLTPREASRLLRVSLGTLYACVRENRIESIRLGTTIRIPRHAIIASLPEAS
jgi:excisionase family DNA binding protein